MGGCPPKYVADKLRRFDEKGSSPACRQAGNDEALSVTRRHPEEARMVVRADVGIYP